MAEIIDALFVLALIYLVLSHQYKILKMRREIDDLRIQVMLLVELSKKNRT